MDMLGNSSRKSPKVSIGMPVFNGELLIRKALDALLAQTFSDFEIIISDNASTDNTGLICQEYAAKDHRIIYVRQSENKGIPDNFRYVLRQARSDYFMWAAHDDFWEPTCLQKWVEVLDADEGAVLAFSNVRVFSHVSGFLNQYSVSPSLSKFKEHRLFVRFVNVVPGLIYGLMRRNIVERMDLDFFDFFDIYFGYFMALEGKIVVVHEYLYNVGVKDRKRTPYSLMGNRIRVQPFFKKCLRLFWCRLSFCAFGVFLILSIRQAVGCMKSLRQGMMQQELMAKESAEKC